MRVLVVGLVGLSLLVSGCETTSSRPYAPSTNNILKIQSVAPSAKVAIAKVTLSPGVDGGPTCRMLGSLDLASGRPVEAFVEEAFRQELFMAGVYDVRS